MSRHVLLTFMGTNDKFKCVIARIAKSIRLGLERYDLVHVVSVDEMQVHLDRLNALGFSDLKQETTKTSHKDTIS